MPTYHYKAVAPGGILEEGRMEAEDARSVIHSLQATGYLPIRADSTERTWRWARLRARARQQTLKAPRIAAFTHDLAMLLRSGLPLDQSLRLMAGLAADAQEQQIVKEIETALHAGRPLSAALAEERSHSFPPLYTAMVRAGEAGGTLDATLTRLHEHLEHGQTLRRSVRSALIYPTLLLGISLLSVLMLLLFVIPEFGQLLADSGQPVPASTRIVVSFSEMLRAHGWIAALALLAGAVLLRHRLRQPQSRERIDALLLRTPLIGELIRHLDAARFTRTLGVLLQNGVPLLSAVDTAGAVIANHTLRATLPSLADSLKHGRGLAEPLVKAGQFPRLSVQLIRIGEESGRLDEMLLRCADILDTELRQRLQNLIAVLEPALIVVLGIVIAGILMSLLTAILGMNDLAM